MLYVVAGPNDTIRVIPYDIFHREITIKGSFAEISSFPPPSKRRAPAGSAPTA